MRITVAICTWNRSALLRQTLNELTRIVVPADLAWELIVVDNNSTDATAEVVRSFGGRLPVRSVFEPRGGLSNARNRAVEECTGDYIVWTDDDVLVDPGWLDAYASAFARWPDAVVFGGPVDPWFPNEPPAWLVRVLGRVSGVYSVRDFGAEVFPLDARRLPFGANMAFRRDVLVAHPFDPELGHSPRGLIGGEETVLIQALLRDGGSGWWVPDARVRHYIPEDRQTIRYLRRRLTGQGEQAGLFMENAGAELFGRPRWLWRRAAEAELRYRIGRIAGGPDAWIDHLMDASHAWGQLRGYRRRRREARAPQPLEADPAAADTRTAFR